MKRLLAAAVALASLASGAADDVDWYVQIDNDVVFDTDRWYSSGVRIARVHHCGDYDLEYGLLHEVYTPEAGRFFPGVVDRAPTARLLLSFARHDHLPDAFQTIELAAGLRGPAAYGRQVTRFVHRIVPAPEVDWSRQERNRADIQLAGVRTHSQAPFDIHYGALAGNQIVFAHAGFELRAGPAAISSPLLRFAPTPPLAEGGGRGWSAFAGASLRAVVRNAMLERSYDVDGGRLERRRGVARVAAGAALAQSWGSVSFALARDTREFSGQRRPQDFGSLLVHIPF